jgi:diguanylate cyclase (GGDEF)-like protein
MESDAGGHEIRSRLGSLLEETTLHVALFDPEDRVRFANAVFRHTFAIEEGTRPSWAGIMRRCRETGRGSLIVTRDFEGWLASAKSRRGKLPFRAFEADLTDGRWIWVTETVDAEGWMLCIASDITHLRASERDLRQAHDMALRASHTDELTGLSNRRAMMSQLEAMARRGEAGAMREAACILDIDFFKRINDVYGHQAGDTVLLDFARRLDAVTRRQDSFGRIGGEEFMLLLPGTSLLEAEAIIERILALVRDSRPLPDVPTLSYTCSAGIAAFVPGDTVHSLYARADAALYAAKRAGRDRFAIRLP